MATHNSSPSGISTQHSTESLSLSSPPRPSYSSVLQGLLPSTTTDEERQVRHEKSNSRLSADAKEFVPRSTSRASSSSSMSMSHGDKSQESNTSFSSFLSCRTESNIANASAKSKMSPTPSIPPPILIVPYDYSNDSELSPSPMSTLHPKQRYALRDLERFDKVNAFILEDQKAELLTRLSAYNKRFGLSSYRPHQVIYQTPVYAKTSNEEYRLGEDYPHTYSAPLDWIQRMENDAFVSFDEATDSVPASVQGK